MIIIIIINIMIYIMDVYNCNVFVDTERMIHQWMVSGVPYFLFSDTKNMAAQTAMFTIPFTNHDRGSYSIWDGLATCLKGTIHQWNTPTGQQARAAWHTRRLNAFYKGWLQS